MTAHASGSLGVGGRARWTIALCAALAAGSCGSEGVDGEGATDVGHDGADVADDAAADVPGDGGADGLLPPQPLVWCPGPTRALYAPADGPTLDVFPDDRWTLDDPTSRTGVRLRVDEQTPWLLQLPGEAFANVFRQLNGLDGFGVNAGIFLRFAAPIAAPPSGRVASLAADAPVQLWRLPGQGPAAGPAVRLPFEATRIDGDATLLLHPLEPLQPKARHVVWVRATLGDANGACLQPSAATAALLQRSVTAAADRRLALRWQQALAAVGADPASVAALTVFTTAAIVDDSLAIATDVRSRKHAFINGACVDKPGRPWRLCQAEFDAADYRDDSGHLAGSTPWTSRRHKARIWLPKDGKGPWPVLVFGHGLTGDSSQGDKLADFAAPLGVVGVAIDAVAHGQHPAGGVQSLGAVFKFFGINAGTLSFDFLQLRDNWRQSTYDKLGLLRAIADQPDFDSDGSVDFDVSAMGYVGVSLGGIMGPELLALSPELRYAVLSVPGGRVMSIIGASKEFAPLIMAFQPPGTTKGDVERFFAVVQAQVDPGDAAAWGPYVLAHRLPGMGAAPDLLLQMAIGDSIVPNVATRALARALGVPVVGKALQTIDSAGSEGSPLPVSANHSGVTAGLFQYDRLREKPAEAPKAADHSDLPACIEAQRQDMEFLQAWRSQGRAVIVDPYALTGTPPLP